MLLGLDIIIWIILAVYFAGMLLMGWWSKRSVSSQEGYLGLVGISVAMGMVWRRMDAAGISDTAGEGCGDSDGE